MKCSILLLVLCSFLRQSVQEGEGREPFSWTRGLKRAGGRQGRVRPEVRRNGRNGRNSEQLPSLSDLGRDDKDPDDRRTGYGYTRGSKEFDGRRRPTNLRGIGQSGRDRKLVDVGGRSPGTQTVRPRMSLAAALRLLENTSVDQASTNDITRPEQRQHDTEIRRPRLRQGLRGRKVAAIPVVTKDMGLQTDKPGGSNAPGPTGYGYTRGSQEFLESRGSPAKTVRGRPAGDQGVQLRQGKRGRQVPPIPSVYEYEEYGDYGEVYQDYGDTYQDAEEEEDPHVNLRDVNANKREEDSYGRGRDDTAEKEEIEETYVAPSTDDESGHEESDEGECGPECRNLLHELEHPKEHERCPNAGMVIDIWGYCRYIFHEERRDWAWWQNLRTFVMGGGNSWYNSYRPTAYEEG